MKIEALFVSVYMYFAQSINRHLEHTKLAEIMETKGLTIFMLTPSKHALFKYKSLVVKMNENSTGNAPTKTNYELLYDFDIVLGLTCVLSMLELVQSWSKMT